MKRQRLCNKFEEICGAYLDAIRYKLHPLVMTPWGEILQLPSNEFILFSHDTKEAYYLKDNRDLLAQVIGEIEFQIIHLQRSTHDHDQAKRFVHLKYKILERYCPYSITNWRLSSNTPF